MPSDSLSIASSGLLQAERDAARAASRIVNSAGATTTESTSGVQIPPVDTAESGVAVEGIEPGAGVSSAISGASSSTSLTSLDSSLIQDLSDLRAASTSFSASAAAFSAASESLDELDSIIGSDVDTET